MDIDTAVGALGALAQATRLSTFKLLVEHEPTGLPAGEIAARLDVPQNTLSTHLAILVRAGLAKSERHSRSIIYRADLDSFRTLNLYLLKDCCGGSAELCAPLLAELTLLHSSQGQTMTDRIYNVLFLCTGNSARSILAESILHKLGQGRFNAYSAGSLPKGEVNPLALQTLQRHGFSTDGLRSKSWEEFSGADAPQLDFVFTVCDNAANEVCPVWPGQPMTAHWGIEDPAAVEGTDEAKLRAFNTALIHMKTRISLFLALPLKSIERLSLKRKLDEIGQSEGSTHPHPRPEVA